MISVDWDDDRIKRAFRAAYERPAPPSIALSVHEALTGLRPGPVRRFADPLKALAAGVTAVLVVFSGAAILGSPSISTTPDPLSSDVGVSAPASAAESGSGSPATSPTPGTLGSVMGLDIITVSDALAIRELEGEDREIAVTGWFTPPPPMRMRCRAPSKEEANNVLLPWCQGAPWLTEQPEVLVRRIGDSPSSRSPVGPGLNPHFDGLASSWMPSLWSAADSEPPEVVLLGHFDDRRARLCPASVRERCQDQFVVDRVARVDGAEPPLSHQIWVTGSGPHDSLEDVLAVVAKVSPGSEVLSVVTADSGSVGRIEPELEYVPDPGFDATWQVPIKWIVRVLESGHLETYVVWDDTDIVWQMTDDGPVRIGSTLRRPHGWGTP